MRCVVLANDDAIDAGLTERVLAEYREMPGLALTIDQARRLWGGDALTCRCVIDALVARGILRWSPEGRLILARSDDGGLS